MAAWSGRTRTPPGPQGGPSSQALGWRRGGFSTTIPVRAEGGGKPLTIVRTGGERHEQVALPDLLDQGAVRRGAGGRPRLRRRRLAGDQAVLALDETGFVKQGAKLVGVQRQYSGTAGKVEHCQLAVFLAYVTARGHVLLDRRLYLPESWTTDPARCRAATVPDDVELTTMPALGQAMREHAWAQGVPFAWVTADERYGGKRGLLATLKAHDVRSVMAVPSTTRVWADGATLVAGAGGLQILTATTALPQSVAAVVANWEPAVGQRAVVAAGAKGPRTYEWGAVRVVASREQWPGPPL